MSGSGPIEVVAFDLGNVLIPWDRDRLYAQLIEDPIERADFLDGVMTMAVNERLDRGEPFDVVLAEVAEAHPEVADLVLAFGSRWSETLGEANDEMVALLSELRGRVTTVALTNWAAETFPVAQARFPWLDWFDDQVVSGREGVIKPEPAIYELVERRTGADPGRIWFTDDSQRNVDAALERGWQALLFTDAASVRSSLRAGGIDVGDAATR